MTNDKWEENRKLFAEKYKDKLPIKCQKEINAKNKLRVLIGCLFFKNFTGSELHVYELAKELSKKNCEVHIISQLGDKMVKKVKKYGIKCFELSQPPGFKLGDGVWGLNTPKGNVVSEKNKLYKIKDIKYDILHINHKPIGEHLLKLYPNIPSINTIHSEVIPNLEDPVVHDNVKKYIAIRPQIKKHIEDNWGIKSNKIKVIYNPIDNNRFKHYDNEVKNITLFVGTIDYLRKDTILDLIDYTKKNNKELWLVGEKKHNFIDEVNEEHVKYFPPTWDVEKYVKECSETASILLGRTTIEGWLCNKPGWIYDIDRTGYIIDKKLHPVPKDVDKFKSNAIADQVFEEYLNII
jgi:glycosyltransferase involved in cell wall biosynthesis